MQSYIHFTIDERILLQDFVKQKLTIREMARRLGRSPSSVSRELKRNSNKNKSYTGWRAEVLTISRKNQKCRPTRLAPGSELHRYVCEKLDLFWPPECIAACWNREHPEDHVGFSTIYRWLKKGLLSGYSRKKHLRRRGKKIQTRKANYNTVHPDRLIKDWPEPIRTRERLGDFEGDTIYGAPGKGYVVTLVDRKSRYLIAGLCMSRKPEEINAAIFKAVEGSTLKSLSLDQGSEFASFHEIEKELGIPVYFAKPHAPWQRGTNENTNGILRFFFPKGCDFRIVSEEQLADVVDLLNHRPRKCLGWNSPAQIFLNSVALT